VPYEAFPDSRVPLPEKNDLRRSTIQKRHEKGKAYTVGDRKDGEGYPLRGDRKSAEVIDITEDGIAPWRKRMRKLLITLGLQGCDKKERSWRLCTG
jgi:hypothetical protein